MARYFPHLTKVKSVLPQAIDFVCFLIGGWQVEEVVTLTLAVKAILEVIEVIK